MSRQAARLASKARMRSSAGRSSTRMCRRRLPTSIWTCWSATSPRWPGAPGGRRRLRPHAKAHKTLEIARRQLDAGADRADRRKAERRLRSHRGRRGDLVSDRSAVRPVPPRCAGRWSWPNGVSSCSASSDVRLAEQLGAEASAGGGVLGHPDRGRDRYGRFGVPKGTGPPGSCAVAAIPGCDCVGSSRTPATCTRSLRTARPSV
jgi:hypothetical protein